VPPAIWQPTDSISGMSALSNIDEDLAVPLKVQQVSWGCSWQLLGLTA
jgi:hypothetical protein